MLEYLDIWPRDHSHRFIFAGLIFKVQAKYRRGFIAKAAFQIEIDAVIVRNEKEEFILYFVFGKLEEFILVRIRILNIDLIEVVVVVVVIVDINQVSTITIKVEE